MTDLDPDQVRELADDPKLMAAVHLKIENMLIDMRDSRMSVMNANGLTVREADGSPSDTIRIGTRWAVQIAVRAIADELAGRERARTEKKAE